VDILDLLPEPKSCPTAESQARKVLLHNIQEFLHKARMELAQPCVLLVTSPGLLLRYDVGLNPFYSFVGDRRLAIIVVDSSPATGLPDRLPRGVEYDGSRISTGLLTLLADADHFVQGDNHGA